MKHFFKNYLPDNKQTSENNLKNIENKDVRSFLQNYGGISFNKQLYRIFPVDKALEWQGRLLPNYLYNGQIDFFGYDWMGRVFARYIKNNNEHCVLLFSQQSMGVFEIPATLVTFHDEVLIENEEPALEISLYKEWRGINPGINLSMDECVGLKSYLFSGGDLSVDNLSVTDMEVDWDLAMQLFRQINSLDSMEKIYKIDD